MKRGGIFLVFLILIAPAFAVLNEYGSLNVEYNSYLHIASVKYEPYPAEPGKYFDLWIKIQNSGLDKADVKFKLTPKYPFSLDANEAAERTADGLSAGETTLLHYKIRSASTAVEGSTPLDYEAQIGNARQSSNINIWIQTIDANVDISSVKTQVLVPGKSTPVEIELENKSDSPMNNIDVKLDLTAATLPFIPINSTTEKKLFFIEPGRKNSIIFNLMALPGASANAYKVPILIKYTDGVGKTYNKTGIIGLIVGSSPDFMVTVSSSDIYSKGIGNIALKATNRGITDTKLVSANLKPAKEYDVISENNVYLGNIDSDDYETAEYRIRVKKIIKGAVPLQLELNYLDANNNRYSEVKEIDLKIVSAKDLGLSSNGGLGRIIFVIILISACYYFYRKWEKKKLAKK